MVHLEQEIATKDNENQVVEIVVVVMMTMTTTIDVEEEDLIQDHRIGNEEEGDLDHQDPLDQGQNHPDHPDHPDLGTVLTLDPDHVLFQDRDPFLDPDHVLIQDQDPGRGRDRDRVQMKEIIEEERKAIETKVVTKTIQKELLKG